MSLEKMWAKRIRAFERGGLTRRAWCAREGLSVSTRDYWRRRLRDAPTALVPVVVSEAPTAAKAIEISVAGMQLRVSSAVDADWLSRVLRGLR